jgi:hypothetical protein
MVDRFSKPPSSLAGHPQPRRTPSLLAV